MSIAGVPLLSGCASTPSPSPTGSSAGGATSSASPPTISGVNGCLIDAKRLPPLSSDPSWAGYFNVQWTNTGTAPCTLKGYGSVQLIDHAGNAVSAAPDPRHAIPEKAIILNPGQNAYTMVVVVIGPYDQSCQRVDAPTLRLVPPVVEPTNYKLTNDLDISDLQTCVTQTAQYRVASTPATNVELGD